MQIGKVLADLYISQHSSIDNRREGKLKMDEVTKVKEMINSTREIERYKKMFDAKNYPNMDIEEAKELSRNLKAFMNATNIKDAKLNEMITSGKAEFLIPEIIVGAALEGQDPDWKVASLFNTIQYSGGSLFQIPAIGELRAGKVAEGSTYPEADFDINQFRNLSQKVEKFGVAVKITEECLENSQWDVLGIWLRKAGRAMQRLKEEQCLVAMLKHGHVVFDADSTDPSYQVTGLDVDGVANKTLSVLDFIDLLGAVMYNNHSITDIIMHPLAWLTFLKNELVGAYSQTLLSYDQIMAKPSKQLKLGSAQDIIARNMPIPVNIIVTPYAPFDRVNRVFDMIAIDRNNVGVILQKEGLSTEQFDVPERDIMCIKLKEKYGIGIIDEGRGVAIAKNIALAPTFSPIQRVHQVS